MFVACRIVLRYSPFRYAQLTILRSMLDLPHGYAVGRRVLSGEGRIIIKNRGGIGGGHQIFGVTIMTDIGPYELFQILAKRYDGIGSTMEEKGRVHEWLDNYSSYVTRDLI